MKKQITLGVANLGEEQFDLDLVSKWELSKITNIGDTVFFEAGGSFYSMRRKDYNEYFNN